MLDYCCPILNKNMDEIKVGLRKEKIVTKKRVRLFFTYPI